MKTLMSYFFLFGLLVMAQLSCAPVGRAPSAVVSDLNGTPVLRESGQAQHALRTAPAACLDTLRALLAYASKDVPDILTDTAAQDRWLTPALKQGLLAHKQRVEDERKRRPDDRIDAAGNGDFIGFWDTPTTFTVLGSRAYGDRAVVDVQYAWGPGTNYEGDTEIVSYSLAAQDGRWRLDDVYQWRGPYVPTGQSLSQRLQAPL